MFETMQIAKRIKELRIKKNMTQMNLADMIGVSYQAVSNWERGNAMPDISKLSELANIFECSIDDLLGESRETKVIKKIMDAEAEGEIPDISIQEMGEIAPLLKPDQTEGILEGLIRDQEHLRLKDVIIIAPFLSEELLDQLVENSVMEGDYGDIVKLAPFLSDKTLDKIVRDIVAETKINIGQLAALAPYLTEELLEELAESDNLRANFKGILALAPFLTDESLTKLAKDIMEKEEFNMNEVISLAPYLQTEFLDEVVDKLTDTDTDCKIAGLFPFLSEAGCKKIAEKIIKRGDYKALASLAPFIS